MIRFLGMVFVWALAAVPLGAAETPLLPSDPGLEALFEPAQQSPASMATLGTCRVSCRLIGGTLNDIVRYEWQTTYALCCDPAIDQCDPGYRAFGLSFNSTKCNWF